MLERSCYLDRKTLPIDTITETKVNVMQLFIQEWNDPQVTLLTKGIVIKRRRTLQIFANFKLICLEFTCR